MYVFFLGVYHGDRHFVIQDGILICLALGSLTIHFQPLGPPIQYLQERQSIRYWGSRLLPPSFYNSLFGICKKILNFTVIHHYKFLNCRNHTFCLRRAVHQLHCGLWRRICGNFTCCLHSNNPLLVGGFIVRLRKYYDISHLKCL